MTDQELKDLVAGLAVKSDRLDAQLAATAKTQDRTSQERKEFIAGGGLSQAVTAKAQDRNDALFAATDALFAANALEFAATARQVAQTSRKLESIGIQLGNIGQNQGCVAEEFFFNSLQAKPVLGGVRYEEVIQNAKSINGKLQGEYDVVMVNGKSVALTFLRGNPPRSGGG